MAEFCVDNRCDRSNLAIVVITFWNSVVVGVGSKPGRFGVCSLDYVSGNWHVCFWIYLVTCRTIACLVGGTAGAAVDRNNYVGRLSWRSSDSIGRKLVVGGRVVANLAGLDFDR